MDGHPPPRAEFADGAFQFGIAAVRPGTSDVAATVTKPFEAQDDPDINFVWSWFEYQMALVAESRAHVLRNTASDGAWPVTPPRPHEAQSIGQRG
jgi:hypothetical protein